jgi:hypothetical protein
VLSANEKAAGKPLFNLQKVTYLRAVSLGRTKVGIAGRPAIPKKGYLLEEESENQSKA